MIKLSQLIVHCSNCGWIGRTKDVKAIYSWCGEEVMTIGCPDCSADEDYTFGYTWFFATKEGIKLLPRQFDMKKFAYRLN